MGKAWADILRLKSLKWELKILELFQFSWVFKFQLPTSLLTNNYGFLGSKQFLMGDKPIEADCAIFGMLAQCLWNCPGSPFEQLLNGNTR